MAKTTSTSSAGRKGRTRRKDGGVDAATIFDALDEIHAERNIDKHLLIEALEEAVAAAFRRHHDIPGEVRAHLLPKGGFRIEVEKTVVENVDDEMTEISQKDPKAKGRALGDRIFVEIKDAMVDFGRIAAQTAKQVVRDRLREAERSMVFEHYRGRVGNLVSGKVQRIRPGHYIVEIDGAEAILPRREVPPREEYREGERVKSVILAVRKGPKGTQIVLSRSHPLFLQRLLEQEVSEVHDGTVEVKAIAREPGVRAKVAVISHDPIVDPIGACVGQRGIRVQTIVRELGGERIDIIRWHADLADFVRNALSPAEVERVDVDETNRVAKVLVSEASLSQAIGKEGLNARLAARLTGWRIDIKSHDDLARERAAELWKGAFLPESAPDETVASAPTLTFSPAAPEAPEAAPAAETAPESAATSAPSEGDTTPKPPVPYVLPDGREISSVEGAIEILDTLPPDEASKIVEDPELRRRLVAAGAKADAVAAMIRRYR